LKNILIIEDTESVRNFLREKISSLVCDKCRIFEAENGLEGVKLAEKVKPDIIFIDVVMPKLNGYVVAIRLKNMESLKNSVLIAMTSETDTDVEKKMLAFCHDFLPKPIDEAKLKKIVAKYLKQKGVRKKTSVDAESFDAIANEIVLSLQEKVEELTVVNRELQEKNKTIESLYREADRAKLKLEALINFRQDFLDFIFHEIKGPLSAILGNSELLQLKFFSELGEEGNLMVEKIINASLRIKKLMDQIARFNTFDFEIKGRGYVKIAKAVDEVILRYGKFIKEKNLSVKLDCDNNCRIKINRGFLIEIIDPLIRNAIVFNKNGGAIEVLCRKENDENVIEISDTGIGMNEKQIKQAFIPFVQFIDVEHYKTHKLKGLGLGLAMCKKMVEMARGRIFIESEIGKGTKVKIILPERI